MRPLRRAFAASASILILVAAGIAPTAAESVDPVEDVYAFGGAGFHGSTGSTDLHRPIVGMTSTPTGDGYWLVASDGGIFSYGDAGFHGSTGDIELNRPIVGMAATPSGGGYWLVASDGGIFAFGDSGFHGSTGDIELNEPVVGMAPTPTGFGYWLVASDGGIFAFGDAGFHGSAGNIELNEPIVGMTATPTGGGYWFVASDGGIFAHGDAPFHGSAGSIDLDEPIVGMASTPDAGGYWLAARDGGVFTYGTAEFHGSAADRATKPVTGISATPSGDGYWLAAINTKICRNPEFVALYPPRWHTNSAANAAPCRYFDPRPVGTVEGPEGRYDLALSVYVDAVDFERVAQPDERGSDEISRRRVVVDGHRGVAVEQIANGRGALPRGTFTYLYIVEVERGRTLVAATYDVGDSSDTYRNHKVVLDDLMSSMEIG